MRIALLTDGITPYVTGGMQRHSYHLARQFLKLGIDLTLVHSVAANEPIPTQKDLEELLEAPTGKLNAVGLHFPKSGSIPGHYIRESYVYACRVYEALEDEWNHFDFIYAKGLTAWCLLENRKKGAHTAPVGVKFHGYEMFQKAGGVKDKFIQFMFRPPVVFNNREANVVFSYGGEITSIIEKIGVSPERIISIGSGIDDEWILPKPLPAQGKRRFLFIGRNERRKGITELIRCASLIESLDVEFHWIGPIPQQKQLKGAQHFYHGEIKDSARLLEIIDQCQVLVAPSHSEGMPNVILEAMSRGLAILATHVGAVPMLVSEENGMLIAPRRTSELRKALSRFAELPQAQLDIMRANSIERVSSRFRWSVIAQQTLAEIKKVTYSG
jgi:glycosyltransferase involved in cell wall biosynthesis